MSDGYQSLDFAQFEETMALCRRVAEAVAASPVDEIGAPPLVVGSGAASAPTFSPGPEM